MMLVAGCLLAIALSAAPQRVDRAASRFQTVLYLHGGPQHDADFFRRVRELGYSAVSIPAGGDPRPAVRAGLDYYLDQILGKGVLELTDEQWDPVFNAYQKSRDPEVLLRPTCLSEKKQMRSLLGLLQSRASAVVDYPPFAISLGDEISLTRRGKPLDLCHRGACREAFSDFLRKRYRSISDLNRGWETNYKSFLDVRPWSADEIRARELVTTHLPKNLRPWSDHLQFRDDLLARVVESLGESAKKALPRVPCGLTGMQPPSAYGGHHYGLLMPTLDFFEAYDIGGARNLALCMAPPGAMQMTTLMPMSPGQPPRMVELRLYEALAQGMSGVIIWSSGDVFADGRQVTEFGQTMQRLLGEAEPAMAAFAGARIRQAPVWLVDSQASTRMHWMFDSAADGKTWLKRFSSYEASHSTSMAARESWTLLFEDLGLQVRWVSDQNLSSLLKIRGPKLLVLPASMALSNQTVAAIESYVESGGHLLADHGAALYDADLVLRPAGGLDHVFGISRRSSLWRDLNLREGRPFGTARLSSGGAAVESGLTADLAEQSEGFSVQIEHPFGRGTAVYLNMAVCEYAQVRLLAKRVKVARDLRSRVRRVLQSTGVTTPMIVRGKNLPTCIETTLLSSRDGRQLLSIRLNASQSPELMTQMARRGSMQITVEFREEVQLRNLCVDKDLGSGMRFELELDPWRALLLSFKMR